jgi:RNA polymerase sigma-70 factor (ECF subfamily)
MQQLAELIFTARCMDLTRAQRHAAFGQLVDQFQAALYARAVRMVRDPQLAQDITQETLLTAYQQLPHLREPAAFPIWLNQILRTHCNRLRRPKRLSTVSIISIDENEMIDISTHDPAATLATTDMRENVLAAIATLPDHERIVVYLFYLQDFSLKEIAERLKLPLTTIKKRLQYARARLRTQVSEMAEGGMARFQAFTAAVPVSLLPIPAYCLAPVTPLSAGKMPFPRDDEQS